MICPFCGSDDVTEDFAGQQIHYHCLDCDSQWQEETDDGYEDSDDQEDA